MYNPFSLAEKSILVTGASSGIGRATAIECSRMGAKVVITGRDSERLQETFTQLSGTGHSQIIADLLNAEAVNDMLEKIPTVNGVALCSGAVKTMPVKFIKEEDLSEIMRVNYYAPVLLIKNLLKNKKIAHHASVVLISSLAVYFPIIGNAIYSGSKGALTSMARVLAVEALTQKIRVNSILPGMVKTNMISDFMKSKEESDVDQAKYPLGYGEPEDVAYAAIYLLSDAAKWMTGSEIIMDGGMMVRSNW